MTGVFQLFFKKPKGDEVHIPPTTESRGVPIFPDMKDSSKFDFEHVKDVELPHEILDELRDWWIKADFCEEFIVRCDLPT